MQLAEPVAAPWKAELALRFERADDRTVLAARRHDGPLVVQKPLYPEGGAVCHAIVIHPPAGIAGGDELALEARAGAGAHALLTTPGAGKWYRSAGPWARQRLDFEVGPGALLEWLPQETIVFDGALASLASEVRLEGDARYLGWEILCLGRTGSGERFVQRRNPPRQPALPGRQARVARARPHRGRRRAARFARRPALAARSAPRSSPPARNSISPPAARSKASPSRNCRRRSSRATSATRANAPSTSSRACGPSCAPRSPAATPSSRGSGGRDHGPAPILC